MIKLKVGDPAPDFELLNEKEKTIKLSTFKGKSLILFFYPKDDTPACTKEACSLRDNYKILKKQGFQILGISPDKPSKHRKFIEKFDLPYALGADTETKMMIDFGVWGPKKFMGREYIGVRRTTFVIDKDSNISHIIENVRTKDHAEQIMEIIKGE